jgi:hypothetical protein
MGLKSGETHVNSFQVSPEQALASIIRKSSVPQGKRITYGNMTGSRLPSNLHCAQSSYGLQARFHQKANAVQFGKACKLCATGEDETEEHHLLRCPVFFCKRVAFCDALTRQLKDDFPQKYSDFCASSGMLQTTYLLERTEPHWAPLVSTITDMLIRPYLTALATRRKALMKDVD